MQTDRITNRIESFTGNLTSAVQGGNGAQFSMLLSLISTNQEYYRPESSRNGGDFQLPEPEQDSYIDPNELHTPQVVDRLNHSINDGLAGDYAYLVSHITVESELPRGRHRAVDDFAKVSLMSAGKLMLDEIAISRQQISVSA
ncbi:MAG: hypothetical protein OIF57_12225 [Marinobacterium sp.]|nr:hypothetical protein [Marinobacterium sp.]